MYRKFVVYSKNLKKEIRLRSFGLFICLLVSVRLFCAGSFNLHFSQISTQDGLSQNTVRSIVIDKKGFIWVGTLDGLNRYDGYRIKNYKPQLLDQGTLTDHRIRDVFQDKDGYLWIKSYGHEFSCYDPVQESFIAYLPDSFSGKNVLYNECYEASNGDIWLWGNNYGCLQIKKEEKTLHPVSYLTEETSEKNRILFLYEDSRSTIWIGTTDGLFCITENGIESLMPDRKYTLTDILEVDNSLYFLASEGAVLEYNIDRKTFHPVNYDQANTQFRHIAKADKNGLLLSTNTSGILYFNINSKLFEKPRWAEDPQLSGVIDFLPDGKGGILIYNHTGVVWYYNATNGEIKKMTLIPDDIMQTIDLERYSIFIDSDDIIWITTYGNGFFCYDRKNDTLRNYKYIVARNSPASNYLLSITEDNYGNIWIGSEYAGLIKVVRSQSNIRIIRPEKENAIGKNNNVRTLYRDSYNDIWVGTKNGHLYVYDKNLTNEKKVFRDITPYSLSEDKDKNIWVATKGKGLYIIDRETMSLEKHYISGTQPGQLSNSSIFTILRDTENRMWIGTFGGGINLATQTPEGLIFQQFFNENGNRRFIRYLYQDSKGNMWACTSGGLIKFDPEALIRDPESYSFYCMEIGDEGSINSNDIKSVYEDSKGNIWIGTTGGGLNKYIPASDMKKEHFIAYTKQDGLSGNIVSGIMEDRKQNLWISTESGITKFDPENKSFIIYQFSDKTYGNHFNENVNIYNSDGMMLWGSLDGILMFDPDSYIPDAHKPPVILTDFFVYDQPVKTGRKAPLKQAVSYAERIDLNHRENTFTIEFASQNMNDPDKKKYTYILENYDRQWSMLNNSHTATYKNLPPGKYIFKVKGTNSDGIWNEESTDIRITIAPPFWKTWYAYTFYFLLLLLILYLTFRLIMKFNSLNNKIKVEKELTNYKLRFFTNISHEFRTPLTLIRGAIENLKEIPEASSDMKKQISLLGRNSDILTRLIDQLLEFRKLQNNVLTLDLEETDIIGFTREIYIGFLELAKQKNIEYLFNPASSSFPMYIDRRKVDKIIYNLLSNAFKFTDKGGKIELKVTSDPKKQVCLIIVSDNGIGIDKNKQHLLFSRFMQINFSSTGTGIGLSLVKEFVEVHKGKIWYENNEGGGSVFNVELSTDPEIYKGQNFITPVPSVAHPANILRSSEIHENISIPEIEDSVLSNYKMLIIDDNTDILNFLVEEFSKYFMVDVAENGETGLNKARENNPDLIICDVMMPGKDGFEVTRILKEDFQTCHIPVILLTAHSSMENQMEGIQSGAEAYIMKPFSLKYLVARVFKLIEQREQLKKRYSYEYVVDGNLISSIDKDKNFYNLINKILEKHLSDPRFSVEKFAELANLRRTIFYKKVKGISGFSPVELIKIRRMKRAAELLQRNDLSVAEIAYQVGFEDPLYFSKCFKAHYNCSPSKFGYKQKIQLNADSKEAE